MHTSTSTQILNSIVKKGKNYYGKYVIVFAAIFSFFTATMNAQSITNYAFSTSQTGSLDAMTGATSLAGSGTLIAGYNDDYGSAVSNIGFTFYFMGVPYTQFSANSNGQMRLGSTIVGGSAITTTSSGVPLIVPMAGDNSSGFTGDADPLSYLVTGTAPNRIFKIQWKNFQIPYNSTGTIAGNMQAWLYEASGRIDFVYGSMYNNSASAASRSIFLASSNTATTAGYVTVGATPTFTAAATPTTNSFAASANIANLYSAANGSRRVYTFTPPAAPASATGLNFTNVAGSTTTLNWTDNATTESGYYIYRSTDGINYSLIATTAANVVTYAATGLSFGTTYYWRVVAFNEGAVSGNLDGSQLTGPATFTGGATAGIVTVGLGGDYSNLTTAFAAINAAGLLNNIDIKLILGYPAAPETYPIVSSTAGAAGAFTIHLYPTVSGLSISGSSTTGTLLLNNAGNLNIDGRVNATGALNLVISNLTTGYAVQFINDASNNAIRYCDVKSGNSSAASGTIVFNTTTGTTGNDGNTIDNCIIHDATTLPLNAIYSAGTSVTADNSGDIITNNSIYNYFGVATASNGVYLASNSASWAITGNKFYQEATRTATTGTINHAIQILTASGGGYTVNNNIIGYATAAATGTTTYTGGASRFIGMDITAANTPVSNIQGNIISNISVTTTSGGSTTAAVFCGIITQAGSFNIGNTTANIIGAASGTGSIAVTSSVGTSSTYYVEGIYSISTGTVNISNNSIGSVTATGGAATTGCSFYGIWGAGTAGNFTINNNLVGSTATANSIVTGTDLSTTASSTYQNFYGIRCDATGNVIVGSSGAGNTIQNVATRTSGSGGFYGYYNGSSAATASYSFNSLSNIAHGWTTTASSGTFYGLYEASTITGTLNILNNNFQNITNLNTTGTIYLMYSSNSTVTANIQNNIYNNIGRAASAASGSLYVFYNGSSPSGVQTFSNNTITNITAGATTSSCTFYGEYNVTSSLSTWNVFNNTVSLITSGTGGGYGLYNGYGNLSCYNNTINNITTAGTLYGLYVGGSVTTGGAVYSNTINSLTSSGASSFIYTLYTAGTTPTIYKNKIYDISETGASGVVYGIYTGGGTTVNIYNNLVGDLKAPSSSLTAPAPSVAGLYTSSGTTINAYYNTFNLNASSTGTNFGTAAVYSTATPTTITLRNNIFNNTSTPAGTGKTVAYQRSAAALTNYGSASNNNDFYAGAPGVANLIFYDGTNSDQTLTAFKTRVTTRESSSITENPPFTSTAGANAGFLHINTAVATQLEGTGAAIATFTDDYDGDSRNASTPDIGADEFNGTAVVVVIINNVSITPAGNQCVATGRTVTANITAGSTNLSSVTLNYSFNGGTIVSVAMTGGTTGAGTTSTWTASIPVATPSNATVNWSVAATDAVTTKSTIGTSYNDEPLTNVTGTATANPANACAGSPVTLSLTLNGLSQNYCTPVYTTTSASGDYIGNVTFAGINNTTGDAANDYTYYSNLTATVVANGSTQYPVSLQAGGATSLYAQQFRIWIDLNQNGVFESSESVFNTSTSVYGATLATGNIVIPSTAYNGTTRMRVLSRYSSTPLVTEPCNVSSAYGEVEDYNVSITGGTVNPATASVVWNDGTNNVGTTNPLVVTPAVNTSYTATFTALGCSKSSNTVAVTVVPVPAQPNPTNSTQCGTGIPAAFVTSGFNSGVVTGFRWYDAQTGGNLLQTGGATFNGSISNTTSFWVSETNGTCESPRVQLIAAVNPPDLIQASVDNNNPCRNTAISLSAAKTTFINNNNYSYSWNASPLSGSGLSGATAGNPLSVTPTAAGTYIYTVTATDITQGCVTTSTVSVTVKAPPVLYTPTASPATVCAGVSSTLTATTNTIGPGLATVGTGTVVNSTTAFPTPYGQYYGSTHDQYLITAAELSAAGIYAGNITSIAWNLSTGYTYAALQNFQVNIAPTALTAMTSTIVSTGFTNVVSSGTYTPPSVTGFATINFTTPFNWNGTSNIIVDVSFSDCSVCNGTSSCTTSFSNNGVVNQTATSFVSTLDIHADGNCTINTFTPSGGTITTYSQRPNMRFGAQTASTGAGSLTYVWTPGPLSGSSVSVSPATTTTYTVTATDPATTCSNTATVTVNVNPLPAQPAGNNGDDQCGTGLTNASVSSNTVPAPPAPVFNWYLVATGGTAVQTGTSTTYQTPISSTTDFYVSEISAAGCEGPRVHISTIVGTADQITVTATPATVCLGGSTAIAATYTPDFNSFATYILTVNNQAGSGITNPVTLTANGTGDGSVPYTVTPTAVGTYIYTISANDPDKGCNSVNTVTVTVSPLPVIDSVRANPTTVCSGGSSALSAYSGITVTGPTGLPATYCVPDASGGGGSNPITSVTFNTLSNTGITQSSPYYNIYPATGNLTTTVNAGQTYALSVSAATSITAVWIDYNRDGVFGASEWTQLWTSASSGTINITIPATATPGQTAMRIRSRGTGNTNGSGDACTQFFSGTGQDYTINIIGVTTQNPNYTYTWTPGGQSGATITVNPASTTSYSVLVTNPVTGCSVTSSAVTVTVAAVSAIASASPSTPVCAGSAVSLSAVAGGGGPFTYSWSDGTSVVGTTNPLTVNPLVTTTYTVTVKDACGNPATASVTVTVNPLPGASIQEGPGPLSVCDPSTQVLTAVTNAGSATYQWTLNGVNISGATSSTYTVSGAGTGTYRVIVTNTATGCSSAPSAGVVVTVNAKPSVITFTPAAPAICNGSSVGLTAGGGTIGGLTTALAEDFNTNAPNWTITNAASSPTVSNWVYQSAPYTDPSGTATFSNFSTVNGGKFAYANSDAGGSGTTTNTILTSPAFSLANYSSANLTFEQAFKVWSSGDATVALEISTNGGTTWSTLQSYLGTNQGTTTNNAQTTTPVTINLSAYLGQSNLRIRYNYVSVWGYYWIVDNIKVSGNSAITTTFTWSPSTGLNTTSGASVTASPTVTTTYTATATSPAGCTNSNTVTVTVNPRPTGVISGSGTYCNGANTATVLSIAVTGAGPWSGTITDGTTTTPFSGSTSPISVTVTPTATTTYTIATLNGSACSSIAADLSGSATVTINPRPTGVISGSGTYCNGANTATVLSIAVTGAGPWSGTLSDGTTFSGSTSPISVTVTPTATTTYTIATLVGSACTSIAADLSGSATVTINPRPTGVLSGSGTYCNGANTATVLSIAVTGAGPWSGTLSDGTTFSGATNPISVTVTPTATTTYTIATLNGSACSSIAADLSGSATVTINPRPTGVISGSGTYCNGANTATVLSIAVTGAGPWSGTITDGTNTTPFSGSSSPISVTVTPTATTTYTIATLNGAQCSAIAADLSGSATVTINPRPTGVISGSGTYCNGANTATVLSIAVTGAGPWSGTLSDGTTFSGSTSPISVTVTPTATTTYTIATLNGSACSSIAADLSGSATVTINPRPTGVISGSGTYCNGANTATVLSIAVTGAGPWSGTLSNGASFSGTTSPISVTVTPTATTTYTIATLNGAQCSAIAADLSGSATVTINPRPTGVISGSGTYCNGANTATVLSIAVTGSGPWSGTLSDGTTFSGSSSPISVTVTPTATTTYTIATLNGSACSSIAADLSGSATVTINPRPTGVISGSGTYCNGANTATVLSIAVTGAGPWSGTLSDGTTFSGSSSPISVTVTPTATTTYTIATLNGAQCSAIAVDLSGSATVTINPRPTGVISGSGTYCNGANTATVLSIAVTGAGPWSGTLSNGASFSGSTSPISVTVTPAATTTYTIATLVGSACSSIAADLSGSATVTINPRPTGVISGSGTYCSGANTATVLSIAVTGAGPWSGTLSDGTTFSGSTSPISVTVTPTTTTTYTIATLVGSACSSIAADLSGSATVTVNPLAANVTATVSQPTCTVATGTITVTAPLGSGTTYSLDGGTYQGSVTFSGVAPGTHSLTAQTSSGCFSPASTSVTVNPQPFTPSAPTVTGIVNVCPYVGTGQHVTYTANAAGATSYNWTIPPSNVTIFSGQGTNTLVLIFNNGFSQQGNQQIRVTATSACGTSAQTLYVLVAQYPTTPNPITGPTNICPLIGTTTTATYSIPASPAAISYNWTVPGLTITAAQGQNTTSITFTYPAGYTASGPITVVAANNCGSSGTRSLTLSAQPASQPGLITGPSNVCENIAPNGTAATYSITPVSGATSYTWTVSGVSSFTGQGTASISFTYPAGYTTGSVSVTATNGCGTGSARTLAISRLNPATPSNIDVINTSPCPNRQYTYTLASMPANATSIQWTIPANGSYVSGQGSTSITVSYPATSVNGTVTAQAVNNCGVSTIRSVTVKLPACPSGFARVDESFTKGTVAAAESMEVKIFPNPTVSDFKLEVLTAGKEEINVRVLNDQGKLFKTFKVMPYQTIALGAELKAGAYLVEVRQGREVRTTKVIKF